MATDDTTPATPRDLDDPEFRARVIGLPWTRKGHDASSYTGLEVPPEVEGLCREDDPRDAWDRRKESRDFPMGLADLGGWALWVAAGRSKAADEDFELALPLARLALQSSEGGPEGLIRAAGAILDQVRQARSEGVTDYPSLAQRLPFGAPPLAGGVRERFQATEDRRLRLMERIRRVVDEAFREPLVKDLLFGAVVRHAGSLLPGINPAPKGSWWLPVREAGPALSADPILGTGQDIDLGPEEEDEAAWIAERRWPTMVDSSDPTTPEPPRNTPYVARWALQQVAEAEGDARDLSAAQEALRYVWLSGATVGDALDLARRALAYAAQLRAKGAPLPAEPTKPSPVMRPVRVLARLRFVLSVVLEEDPALAALLVQKRFDWRQVVLELTRDKAVGWAAFSAFFGERLVTLPSDPRDVWFEGDMDEDERYWAELEAEEAREATPPGPDDHLQPPYENGGSVLPFMRDGTSG
ncbi:MAG: hypothetical protein JNK72_24540 [Myxococcales bacterium]|nr:hypothetical protein [Myxococcales bacterium]